MPEPYNYLPSGKSVADQLTAGIQSGFNVGESVLKMQGLQQTQALQQQQYAQSLQMQRDLGALAANPNASVADYNRMRTLYPQLAEHFKDVVASKTEEQNKTSLRNVTQVYAALEAGKPELAVKFLDEQIAAAKNSGKEQDAKGIEAMKMTIEANPGAAKSSAALYLLEHPGGDKIIEGAVKLGKEQREAGMYPAQLTEQQAKASKAAVDAKFAESNAVQDLAKKGWDITKIQEDIKVAKQNAVIAAAHVAIAKEGNTIKREEMTVKLAEMKQKRDETVREQANTVENARFNIDNLLNTADRILATPADVVESAAGPISARIPTTSQATADFEALIENMTSQAFLAQVPQMKGMGQLSDAEGKKLGTALQSLSLTQSPKQLLENVREAQRLMLKARKNMAAKFGVPETVPDTPAAAKSTSPSDIDALIKKYAK